MISLKEAEDRYERNFGPLRREWQDSIMNGSDHERLEAIRKREHLAVERVRQYWYGSPTQQLCIVAQQIAQEEVSDDN